MNLAVLADDPAALVYQNGSVEVPGGAILMDQLGVAQAKAEPESARLVEERSRLRPRHLALEEAVDLGLILHVPAREERRQGQLGEHDEITASGLGVVKMGQ